MKELLIIFCFGLLALTIDGCNSTTKANYVNNNSNKNSTIEITDGNTIQQDESQINPYSQGVKANQENLKLEQIAKIVFENQMQYVEEPNYPDDRRIKDYKINTIKIEEISDAGFVFSVSYSILPATDKFILAGNGSQGDNGWINNKFHFVDVANNSGTYKITSMATGR